MVPSLSSYFTWLGTERLATCLVPLVRECACLLRFHQHDYVSVSCVSRDYDIVQLSAILPKMIALIGFWVMMIFRLGSLVSDHANGSIKR
jgi:hypothetical protein